MPMPLLKVRFISMSSMPATFCSQANSSVWGQLPFLRWAAVPSGSTRGMFSSRPPPVMWASALIGCLPSASSTGFTYRWVGSITASRKGLPSRVAGRSAPARSITLRTRLKPLECTPAEARPSTTSPGLTFWPVRIFDFSTAPTAKPARSYSPAGYMPGISAVSPPMRAQPESSQPRAMPPTTAAAVSTSSLPQAK
ncbi:hypothetical protein D9M72_240140 [compost metagenome]